ncbi:MAG: IF-2 protein [Myxococcaceae bacterium]|nr:IF-2 protein [Myxococcaceae bacterium]
MTMEEPLSFGGKVARFFKRLLITTALLGLAAVSLFLLSQENARTYTVEVREGKLVVLKGRMMPMGADVWRPPPELVDAYAPVDLKGTQPYGVLKEKFTDRDELDRALFTVLEGLAKPRVGSDVPEELNDGLYYIRRADRLSGLSEEQKISLKTMKTDVAFYSARMKLEDAQRQIDEALVQLKFATESNNRHSKSAFAMLTAVEPQSKVMVETLRKAVNGLSAPANPPAGATPTPAPAPETAAPAPAPAQPAASP